MLLVLLAMLCGLAAGYALRRSTRFARWVHAATMPTVCLLLLLMGLGVGANPGVMDRLPTLGLDALVLTLGAFIGSILCARYAYRRFFLRHDFRGSSGHGSNTPDSSPSPSISRRTAALHHPGHPISRAGTPGLRSPAADLPDTASPAATHAPGHSLSAAGPVPPTPCAAGGSAHFQHAPATPHVPGSAGSPQPCTDAPSDTNLPGSSAPRLSPHATSPDNPARANTPVHTATPPAPGTMRSSFAIILCFLAGVAVGRLGHLPAWLTATDWSVWTLYALMLLVGAGIGNDTATFDRLRRSSLRILAAPAATIIGTLAGVLAASLLLPHIRPSEALMIGSGFGYYSLSSILITGSHGVTLGTIALVSNILRELLTLLFAPLLVRQFGPLAPISAGGATTADTTLPIITRYSGKDFIFVSVVHGILIDLSVPLLVTFFALF